MGLDKKTVTAIFIGVLFTYFLPAASQEGKLTPATVKKLKQTLKKAEELKKQIDPPENLDQKGVSAARRCAEQFNTEIFKLKIEQEKYRIATTLLYSADGCQPASNKEPDRPESLAESERMFIFVSASVPEKTLRSYVRDVHRLGDPNIVLVLRGFVGKGREAFSRYYQWITVQDPSCVTQERDNCDGYLVPMEIDPLLFRKYEIKAVPAFAYLRGLQAVNRDMSLAMAANLRAEPAAMIVSGDVSLDQALEQFCRQGASPGLNRALKQLKGVGFYGERHETAD